MDVPDPHRAQENAVARARTFGWIGEVLLEGWTDRAVDVASGLDWLELSQLSDVRASRWQRVFGAVPPYESVFLGSDAQLGGPVSAELRQAMATFGFRIQRTDVEPDHVGVQCAALAFLYGAEADAHRDGVDVSGLVEVRERFLSEHLRRWVGAYSVAVESVAVEELSGMVGLLVELVGGSQPLPSVAEDLLGDPKTGLKQISRYLTVPSRCGLWLSVPAIQRVAVRAELACGFGPRAKMFESLWCSAVDHQRIQPLVEAFLIALEPWRKVGGPGWQQTRRLLEQIAQQDAIGGAHGSDS